MNSVLRAACINARITEGAKRKRENIDSVLRKKFYQDSQVLTSKIPQWYEVPLPSLQLNSIPQVAHATLVAVPGMIDNGKHTQAKHSKFDRCPFSF
jgi:hypothetical protein